ncbi:MAG: hypothetical protein JXQ30_09645 [Spirochaetes bacterium]|nr:hypothetical protein [Spirochaetota bacterium]
MAKTRKLVFTIVLLVVLTASLLCLLTCATGGDKGETDGDGSATETFTVEENPSVGGDYTFCIALDSQYIYVAGEDSPLGNSEWRIEKRDITTGALVTSFGTNGVVTTNPSTDYDSAYCIVVDSNYIYVSGFDQSPGSGDLQWRIEKRSKETGALITAFDTDGIIEVNPGDGADYVLVTIDDLYIYAAGADSSIDSGQFRIEKRDKTSGALVDAFGTNGVVTWNPSGQWDGPNSISIDTNYMYVTGSDMAPGNDQWRIEKRDKTTGALVTAFGTGGIVTSNPSSGGDWAQSAVDANYIYSAGVDSSPGDMQWRIEKRDITSGALVTAFGTNGVVTGNPSISDDKIYTILVDENYIYTVGNDQLHGTNNSQWRIEKRDSVTGAPAASFGTNGVVTVNPSSGHDGARSINYDESYIYIAGFDQSKDEGQWRIEKRNKATGGF